MSEQTTKKEVTASDNWQNEALQLLCDISQLSERITSEAKAREKDPQITQWVLKRGELIQSLLALITPERIKELPLELSQSISEQIEAIQQMDASVNQALKTSMASIHQQLGLGLGLELDHKYHRQGLVLALGWCLDRPCP